MRPRLLLSALLLAPLIAAALPAQAQTIGINCAVGGASPVLRLEAHRGGIFRADLVDGTTRLSTHGDGPALMIGQSWYEGADLKLDLWDVGIDERIATFRGRQASAGVWTGTLTWRGRTMRLRCESDV